jgi:hypothetical protein
MLDLFPDKSVILALEIPGAGFMTEGSNIERELKENGRLIYSNRGVSMYPLIRQGKDLVVIEPVSGRLKKYDVPLYKRSNDSHVYVLHRIIKVRENDYVIRGDNCLKNEYGITDDQIVGVLTKVIRGSSNKNKKSREITNGDLTYKIYIRLCMINYPVRALYYVTRSAAAKIWHKIRKK